MTRTTTRGTGAARNTAPTSVRCAIYTRKSTEEGLDQEFNSLDAQRESAEAYISSQKHEGWECLPTRYDDGGFTGGNMDRPALKRLLSDIEAGLVDCVVVYKVDRLSRSLLDFTRIMETFDNQGASFVSVTQQFNTTSSMGRLTLNILLSFAQFEREIISERTRDKMAAARRKGKYVGGAPVLGYDIDRQKSRLVVNESEAAQVRQIFARYLEQRALLPTVRELARRKVTTKRWTTQRGKQRGGRTFNKTSLHKLLTNVTYIGQISYQGTIHEGEQSAIVDPQQFAEVQRLLHLNHRTGGVESRQRHSALLKGMLHCTPCGCRMIHSHTTKNRTKRYRYYVCGNAQKRGWDQCPSKSVPAGEIEQYVIDQIRRIGRDPGLVAATWSEVSQQTEERKAALIAERQGLVRQRQRDDANLQAASLRQDDQVAAARAADLLERVTATDRRIVEIDAELAALARDDISKSEVAATLAEFTGVWESLSLREQARVIELLIERVEYDGAAGTVSITYRPGGMQTVIDEIHYEENAA